MIKNLISFTYSLTALNLYTNYLAVKRLARIHKVGIDHTIKGMILDSFRAYKDMPEHGEVVLQGMEKFQSFIYGLIDMEDLANGSMGITREMIEMSGKYETLEDLVEHGVAFGTGAIH